MRTYLTIAGHAQVVEGSTDDALRRWEHAKSTGTFLRFTMPDSDRPYYVNPDWVQSIGDPVGGGVTLGWQR